ncbi:OmpA family protein [Stenotrophomonas sp. SRS1]|uniref:OmpA family protein n=1 Tax=Stenotrophomonas sp. SRS1 TaxID=2870345 RepID=UPI0022376193|nr:OmpA family protein [Stenotrophomonas sp. SRS1]MCW6026807.1 OmpA family protein [Stenotrophomonas sp. SRS1]
MSPSNAELPFPIIPLLLLCMAGCSKAPQAPDGAAAVPPDGPSSAVTASSAVADEDAPSDVPAFPVVPNIVVPDIIGVTPAQRALETSMQSILDPVAGITVSPARCGSGGALINDGGITRVDESGQLMRNGDEGIFIINADGSGTANFEGGLVRVNADGSGTINGTAGGSGDGSGAIIRVQADGSGTYNGPAGLISLDGKGAGTWNGDSGLITNNGDGSGTWNGPQGLLRINADGSGTWNGEAGLITNHGDGTGTIGPPARAVKMPPMPRLQPAGRFPPLKKFAPPGAPCGYLITLNDRVLFDFDKDDIRPDASHLLDTLATALTGVGAKRMDVRGHTDAKGDDAYNQALSERRASSVVNALRQRGAAQDATATGFGESEPVAPNQLDGKDNPAGRQMNRRVEIFVRT